MNVLRKGRHLPGVRGMTAVEKADAQNVEARIELTGCPGQKRSFVCDGQKVYLD
jgi:hypothetical protein